MAIDGFIYISGGLSFSRQQNFAARLVGESTDTTMNVYTFGAGSVDVFVGSGNYFQDTNGDGLIDYTDERDEDAVGLAIENVNFGLVMMKPTNNKTVKYISLKATADFVGVVGIDVFDLSVSGVEIEYNNVKSSNANEALIDFAATNYVVDTGNGELVMNRSTKILRATVNEALLRIDDYVIVRGSIGFEKGGAFSMKLSNGSTKTVTALNVGADNISMFFGVNGPYWDDLNENGEIDNGETNEDAIGLTVNNASLALSILSPTDGTKTRYLGLNATAQQIGFVGVDVFTAEISTAEVNLNLAFGGGATSSTPVIDFTAFSSELLVLFDTNTDEVVTVGELRALSGQADYSSVNGELYASDADAADDITLDAIVATLDTDKNGELSVEEAQAFLTDGSLADTADADRDGKIDPGGMEVATGNGSFYLAEANRRIFASADNVYVEVSSFLYVSGSIALDLGTRETVTLDTGLPAAITSLVPSGSIDSINSVLSSLSNTPDQSGDRHP